MIKRQAKKIVRGKRAARNRPYLRGTHVRPRMSMYKSHTALSVQLIDDARGITLLSKSIKGKNIAIAKQLGADIVALMKKQGIQAVVFDRGGYQYHGVLEAFVSVVREGGILV